MEIICPNNLEIIALKKSEWTPSNSLILRVHEICGINSESVCISLPDVIIQRIEQIQEVDLIERPISSTFNWESDSKELTFAIGPFELKTFEIILK